MSYICHIQFQEHQETKKIKQKKGETMVRTPSYDKSGLKKGTWTPEEDKKLSEYVTRYGCWNWRQLPKYAGLARCGKSCRLRWMNYLRPNIKRGNYSREEEDIIVRLHNKLGNRWSAIAAQLPGRTDNEIKNHWHTYLKKQVAQTTTSTSIPNDDFSQCTASGSSQESEVEGEEVIEANNMETQNPITHKINETSYATEMEFSSIATDYTLMVEDFSETLDSFWSEPFLPESSLMLNNDFSAAVGEGVMYPSGLFSPPHSTGFFDEEQFGQYDNLFSSF